MQGFFGATLALVFPVALLAQSGPIDFSAPGWELAGDHTAIDTVDGRPVLHVRTGTARYRPASLGDGTIEFDMEVTPYRTFVYITFRMQSDREYEELYFRPHKSGLPDAIQYSPVYGVSNWQLYHGAGYTAAARLPPGEWIHVRVVLSGARAAVFVGEGSEPKLVIRELAREPAAGYISLRSFFVDPEAPEDHPGARFRNLVLRPGHVPFDFARVEPPPEAAAGTVTEWQVSQTFAPDSGVIAALPIDLLRSGGWRTVPSDRRGVVVFGRHFPRPRGVARPAVLTRLSLASEQVRTVRFNFGYSDEVSVFLNGQLLFAADDRYSFDEPRREGLIGLDQATLFLPLRRGENELILAISDVFGGWGVTGQFPDREGLTVRAR